MKYAYILQGEVMYVEDRDVDISHLVAPDLTDRFVPIPEGVTVKPGMIYSDGEFMDNPLNVNEQRLNELETLLKQQQEIINNLLGTPSNNTNESGL